MLLGPFQCAFVHPPFPQVFIPLSILGPKISLALVFPVGRGENPLIPKLSERRRSEQVSGFQNQAQPSMCNDCAHEKKLHRQCLPACVSFKVRHCVAGLDNW